MRRFSLSFPSARFAVWGVAPAALLVATTAALSSLSARPAASEPPAPTASAKPTAEQLAFFENKIRPVLATNCYSCHGKEAQMASLRVDSRAALLKGGDSGTSLVPGDPDKSLLVQVVHQTGKIKMPQGGKLKDSEIADLAAWVQMGAPWPEEKPVAPGGESWRKFWSFQPVRKPAVPKVKNTAWVKSPIDAFLLAKMEAQKFTPAAPADKRTLLRRITFDLTGLPPTPDEMAAFLADKTPTAYTKVVDRLLKSPRYGERAARLWLDVARYADTKGYVFVEDRNYPHAYTYRNWVIDSFNNDLPYDRFVQQQIAADLLPEVQANDDKRPLAALGFLTVGRRFLNSQPDIIDDRIDVTMRGFEGLTVACARCHDHKFDPVPTQDYYSLYGVFASSKENTPPISPKTVSEPYMAHDAQVKKDEKERGDLIRAQVTRLREMEKDPQKAATLAPTVIKALQGFRIENNPDDNQLAALTPAFEPPAQSRLQALNKELETLRKSYPPTPEFAMAMEDAPNPHNVKVFKRGNQGNQGEEAPRRFLLALSKPTAERPLWKQGSGRLELARAITAKSNPLTARVFVNRVWLQHFGAGIVRTPSDFGKQGERPTHPELLDWLAAQFMEDNWSVKKLHRRILLSAAYQQSSDVSEKAFIKDTENRLVSHQNRRRLDLEQMRDALLWASGKLDTKQVGGKSVQLWNAPFATRRSVYGFVERQNLPGTFRTFDFASPDSTSAQRFRTTVPQQALFLMNSPFAEEQARAVAALPQVNQGARDDAVRIRRVYQRLFSRLPDKQEVAIGLAYLRNPAAAPSLAPEKPVWQYGWGGVDETTKRVAAFTAFAKFTGQEWRGGEKFPDEKLGWLQLTAQGGHPGRDGSHAVIRRWIAPADAVVSIGGKVQHPSDQGDGIRARVVSSRLGVVGEWNVMNTTTPATIARIVVKKGDTLDFVTDCKTNEGFDGFSWSPVVKQIEGGQRVWAAGQQFSGPMPSVPPLDRYAAYAQALLMTNEFLFVD